jgi:glycosyltransferase involved in cell wall biosynthesis
MRILHCISTLGEGGAERQLVHLANELPARGVDLHVVITDEGVMKEHFSGKAQLHLLHGAGNYDPRLIGTLAKLIRKLHPDVVQTWLTRMDVIGGSAAKLTRTKWLLTERSSLLAYAPGVRNGLRVGLGRRADAIVANSQGGLDYWKSHHPRTKILRRIPNAVWTAAAPRTDAAVPSPARIVVVGRLTTDKNHLLLVDALAHVDNAVLQICGTGPLEAEVRHRAAAFGDRVTFSGHVADVGAVLRESDVFISMSNYEGLPNAVSEAAAAGVPLVLSDIPAHRELFGDDAALYVEGRDPSAVAAALRIAIADRDAAVRRARKAQVVVAQWTPAAIAAEYHRLYEDLLK